MQKYVTLDKNNYVQNVSDTQQEGYQLVMVSGYQAQLLGYITSKIFWDEQKQGLQFPSDYPATDEKKLELQYKGTIDDIKEKNSKLSNLVNDLQEKAKTAQFDKDELKEKLEAAQKDLSEKDQQINDLNTRVGQLMLTMAGKSTTQGGNK